MNRKLLCLAVLAAPLSAAGQHIDFGDDSGNYPNDGECDDPRFEGPGAYTSPLKKDVLRDASDCLALFDSGQVWLVGEGPALFGALAIGEDLGYGGIVSTATQREADAAALSECSSVDSGCEIVARFGADMCVAVARDDEAGWIGWAAGPDSQETTEAAIDECMAGGGSRCTVEDFACNGATVSTVDNAEVDRFSYAIGVQTSQEAVAVDPADPCIMFPDHSEDREYVADGDICWEIYRNDELEWEAPYVNGMLHGTRIERYSDGTVIETPAVNGVLHGTLIERYSNGISIETPYVNGERHGTEIQRHPGGAVVEVTYVNGQFTGSSCIGCP